MVVSALAMRTEVIQMMAGAATLSAATYIPILAKRTINADDIYISLLAGGYASATFISSYLFGRAGDIYGRRLIVCMGLFASFATFFMIYFVYTPESLYIVRVLNGFSIGIYPGALAAYAADSRMKMGRFTSFGALGWGLGTLFAGYAATFEIRYAFLMSALFLISAFVVALTLPPIHNNRVHVPLFPIKTIRANAPVYIAVLVRHSSASAVWTLWSLFLLDIGADLFMVAIVQAINSVSQVIFMWGIGDRFECRTLVIMGLLSSAITFFWFSIATNVYDILPSQILLGLAWTCLYVGSLKYVITNSEEKATAAGLLQSVIALSAVIGPFFAGLLTSIWPGYTVLFHFAVGMSLCGLFLFIITDRRRTSRVSTL